MDDIRGPMIARSTALVAVGALLAGCGSRRRSTPTPSTSRTGRGSDSAAPTELGTRAPGTPLDPAVESILAAALLREGNLLAVYDVAIARVPALARPLRRLRAHHSAHADRLAQALPAATPSTSGLLPSSTAPDASRPARRGPAVAAVLRVLVEVEKDAARAGVAAAGGAPGSAAVLLAEIAGSEEQHAVLLQRLPTGGRE